MFFQPKPASGKDPKNAHMDADSELRRYQALPAVFALLEPKSAKEQSEKIRIPRSVVALLRAEGVGALGL